MASTEQKASLLVLLLGLGGAAAYFAFGKKDQATPAGSVDIKVGGVPVPVDLTVPDPVKAKAYGPANRMFWKGEWMWTAPVGSHVEYANDGSAWCVLNTPATQQRHTIRVGTVTATVPAQLNPLVDLWNLFYREGPPQMPPTEKRSL